MGANDWQEGKTSLTLDGEDVASAASAGLPDGSARDMLDVLCRLSREYGIDWEISHDDSDGPVGFIRAGECDGDVAGRIETLAELAEALGELTDEEFFGPE